jgi:hypothetical protein
VTQPYLDGTSGTAQAIAKELGVERVIAAAMALSSLSVLVNSALLKRAQLSRARGDEGQTVLAHF